MNTIEKYRAAETSAQAIIQQFVTGFADQPDAVAERTTQLHAMKKDELVAIILGLEKPKAEAKPKVEDLVKSLLCDEACAILPYESIAQLVVSAIPEAHTSAKSVASYFSKKGEEWNALKRVKLVINPLEALKAVNG
jgi:uncharacterized alpha-E superfamily protein